MRAPTKKTHTIANAALADERKTTHTQEHAEHNMMAIHEEYLASKHLCCNKNSMPDIET